MMLFICIAFFMGFCVGGFCGATMMAFANAAKERDEGYDERRPL